LGVLVRRHGQFDLCEDAVQEALLAAAVQGPQEGIPANPRGWLLTAGSRRLTDAWRSDQARRRREETVAATALPAELVAPAADDQQQPGPDDTLTLPLLGCAPAAHPASQLSL